MAIKRPTPIDLSTISDAFVQSSATVSGGARVEKTYDPNYPVFDVPINAKVLAYVPRHVVTGADGEETLRMDSFLAHPVRDGRSFHNIRCSAHLENPAIGWDKSCPLCSALQNELWPLYHKEMAALCSNRGLKYDAPETKELIKADSKEWLTNRPIREAERWYTFPIVVIECEEGTVNPKLNEQGQLVGKPCFYSVRENTYNDKWVGGFDTLDGVAPNHPGGLWVVLNFTYQPKSGKPDKMGSAKALKVSYKTNENLAQWAQYFDQLTASWTPQKAMEVLALDAVRTMDDLVEITNDVMKADRDKAALYKAMGSASAPSMGTGSATVGISSTADATLQQFGATPAQIPQVAPTTATPIGGVVGGVPVGTPVGTGGIPAPMGPSAPSAPMGSVGATPLGATPIAPVMPQ